MDIHARAHRILKKLELFKNWQDSNVDLPHIEADEEVIGVYENLDPNECVLFTTNAIYLPKGEAKGWRAVYYDDIVSVETPVEKVSTVLHLNLVNAEEVLLPIRGTRNGRFFDSLEVLRFLDRVLADRNPNQNPHGTDISEL